MAAADQTELEVDELLRANTAAMTHEEMVAPGCCYMLDILWGCVCLYILWGRVFVGLVSTLVSVFLNV